MEVSINGGTSGVPKWMIYNDLLWFIIENPIQMDGQRMSKGVIINMNGQE